MKRITIPDGVKITAVRSDTRRMYGTINSSNTGNRWVVSITKGDKTHTFHYLRGSSLSNCSALDVLAVFKVTMMNLAILEVCPTVGEMVEHLDLEGSQPVFDRLTKLRDKIKNVLGDDFDPIIRTILENVQEQSSGTP